MAHYMPPAIMAFFRPPPPLPFKEQIEKKKMPAYSGIAQWIHRFKDPVPEPVKKKTPQELREARQKRADARMVKRLAIIKAKWDPNKKDKPDYTVDAYKTLFVGRLSFDLTESDLKSEFEYYGPVIRVLLVRDRKTQKSRGYAFVEFDNSKDLKEAYRDADGRKINGRRIVVDVERGRTVKNWLPRSIGGGLGGTRIGGKDVNQNISGRQKSEVEQQRERDSRVGGARDTPRERSDRDRPERDRTDRDRSEREGGGERERGGDRERSDRAGDRPADRERTPRAGPGERSGRSDRDRSDRGRSRERGGGEDRQRDRSRRDRSGSPRRHR